MGDEGAVGGDGPGMEGLLDEGDAAGGGVVAGSDEGPDALGERGAGGDLDGWVAAVGEVEGEVAIGGDGEGEALGAGALVQRVMRPWRPLAGVVG